MEKKQIREQGLSWQRIVERFNVKFDSNFSSNKKAHFDSLPLHWSADNKVVDGAKDRWRPLLLLDAVIFLLENDAFDMSVRRSFNQQRVLAECIFLELREQNPEMFQAIVEARSNETFSPVVQNKVHLSDEESQSLMTRSLCLRLTALLPDSDSRTTRVVDVREIWTSPVVMMEQLLADCPAKSRKKYEMIVWALCNHKTVACKTVDVLFDLVIKRVLVLIPLLSAVTNLAFLSPHTSTAKIVSLSTARTRRKRCLVDTSPSDDDDFSIESDVQIRKSNRRGLLLSKKSSLPILAGSFPLGTDEESISDADQSSSSTSGNGSTVRSEDEHAVRPKQEFILDFVKLWKSDKSSKLSGFSRFEPLICMDDVSTKTLSMMQIESSERKLESLRSRPGKNDFSNVFRTEDTAGLVLLTRGLEALDNDEEQHLKEHDFDLMLWEDLDTSSQQAIIRQESMLYLQHRQNGELVGQSMGTSSLLMSAFRPITETSSARDQRKTFCSAQSVSTCPSSSSVDARPELSSLEIQILVSGSSSAPIIAPKLLQRSAQAFFAASLDVV